MKIIILTQKVLQRIRDGSGQVCSTVTQAGKMLVEYFSMPVPRETIFNLDPHGLVRVIRREGNTLLVETL